ncbi:MAG: hypothetical protein Q7S39_10760 [Ignavibacteria bacterium]|nr:hypothetical protein [Ignavibacteria bacterium]
MKLFISIIFLVLLSFFIPACSENPIDANIPNDLYGVWTFKSFEDGITTMKKSFLLASDNSGFIFLKDSKFVERKNAGWCGTPPIAYTNYDGNWEYKSGDVLSINVGYWGGLEYYELHIISISNSELKFEHVFIIE